MSLLWDLPLSWLLRSRARSGFSAPQASRLCSLSKMPILALSLLGSRLCFRDRSHHAFGQRFKSSTKPRGHRKLSWRESENAEIVAKIKSSSPSSGSLEKVKVTQQRRTVMPERMTLHRQLRRRIRPRCRRFNFIGHSSRRRQNRRVRAFHGDSAAYGKSQRDGIDFAIKQKNAAGGVLGQKIVAIYGDDAGRPEQAVSVAKRLTSSDQVLVLLGSVSSGASIAASQIALETQTPQVAICRHSTETNHTRQ